MAEKKSQKKKRKTSSNVTATAMFERLLQAAPDTTHYVLRLFVTGTSPRSMAAIANIRLLCQHFLPGHIQLEVVDIYQQPLEARDEQIIAAPTIIREFPRPPRRMIGDLSDPQKVLLGLNLIPQISGAEAAAGTTWIKI